MENFGVPLGLSLFVLVANLPIYITLNLDSHIIRLPFKTAIVTELLVDAMFAWFVAGLHFSAGGKLVLARSRFVTADFGRSFIFGHRFSAC